MTSPANDLISFLHHGFIDMLWANWQYRSGGDYINFPFYILNDSVMPGGANPKEVYNSVNHVKVCIPPMSGTMCYQDMLSKQYALLKSIRCINRH